MDNKGYDGEVSSARPNDFTMDTDSVRITIEKKKPGCYVKENQWIVMILAFIAVSVACGLTAHFVTKAKVEESNLPSTTTPHTTIPTASTTKSPTPETTPAPKPTDVRLPASVHPNHYDLELQPLMYSGVAENFTFNGKVSISITCLEATDNVTLNVRMLTIDSDSIKITDQSTGEDLDYVRWEEDTERQFFVLHLQRPLVAGGNYVLSLAFTGPLLPDLTGLYYSQYERDGKTVYLTTSQLQVTSARKVFPCFDEPGFKATFNTTLVVKSGLTALSNMPVTKTVSRDEEFVAVQFEQTPLMSTYLLAFVVCDFVSRSQITASGVEIKVWARSDAIDQTMFALDMGVKITEFFETYFNISYPLPKQDMIAVPDFSAGAMENWGLIIYRESLMFYEEGVSSANDEYNTAMVVAHELAHQWFGNLVTPKWWDDIWLNEGFASYMIYTVLDHVKPSWHVWDLFVTKDLQAAYRDDGVATSHPIYVNVNRADQIFEIFDSISYKKGASVIRMLNDVLGESTFSKGLNQYLKDFAFKNAHHTDLWEAMQRQADIDGLEVDVAATMDTWLLQMGYPVISISRDVTNKAHVTASQTHFLLDMTKSPDDSMYPHPGFNYTWEVPLTYVTSEDSTTAVQWMHKTNISFNVPTNVSWILANVDAKGYYRVNYDNENWNDLIQVLNSPDSIFDVKNRATLIDDAFNLAKAGLVEETLGLRTTQYLSREREYTPWRAALTNLAYVTTMMRKSSKGHLLSDYIRKQVEPLYAEMDWNNHTSTFGLIQERYLKSLIIGQACATGITDCLTKAAEQYRAWMADPSDNNIDVELRSTVYCNAIRQGGVEEWDFAFRQYQTSNLAYEKSTLLSAMACTRQIWLLNRYLDWSLDNRKFRKQDCANVMITVARNPLGAQLTWHFTARNLEEIAQSTRSRGLQQIIDELSAGFNTDYELQQLKDLSDALSSVGLSRRLIQQSIETVETNIAWFLNNERPIVQWLATQTAMHESGAFP